MICSTCGTENDPGRKFCGECGARLEFVCPSCGTANTPGVKFCGECATPLPTAGAAEATPNRQAASTAVAERRLVSVLFADLVGFTPFAEERDAEEVRETLTRYFDSSRAVIERYGGTVEKFIGDAVMAVWGTPVAREDDAERAVRAGLDLIEAVRGVGDGIQARVGILTGEAAVTIGATDQGMVAGDLVNTAARLQSVAPPGTVIVGDATRHAASAAIEFEEAGAQLLKGKEAPVPAHRAVRVIAQRGGQGRSDLPEPPFVGRDEELRQLKEAVALSGREPKARLISITGPGGIGKSRLSSELEKHVDGLVENVYWHRGRSPSYGDGLTFWALGEIVRRRMGLAEDDDEPITRERVHAAVLEWIPVADDQRWVEPALLTLLGVDPAPSGGRDALFAAWRIFFERIAARGTTVLLFEDLQWADSGLLDFIDHMLEWSKGLPILIITLARPELFDRRPAWGAGQRNFTALDLEPLSADSMRELLAGFVPGLPKGAIEAIVGRADGIPLYAVETVRALLAQGRLERAASGYQPVGELGELAIPDTLRSLIASRLDSLDAADRGLLQDASVLGQSFTLDALAAIGEERNDIEERLRGLVKRQLLEVEADPRSPERGQYRFLQSLIREVAYGTLAKRQRREKHLAAARRYESVGDEERAGALASHYLAAFAASSPGPEQDAVAAQARVALRGAADRAVQLGSHEQALKYLRQALDVTPTATERAPLLERAAYSANLAAHNAIAVEMAEEGLTAYRTADDRAGLARVATVLGDSLIDLGDPKGAVERLDEVLGELSPQDETSRAAVLINLARAYYRSNDPQRAIEVADAGLALAERHHLGRLIAEGFANKAAGLSQIGRRREAVALMQAAIDAAVAGGFVDTEMRSRSNLTAVIWFDDPLRAYELSIGNLELARRLGNRLMANWIVAQQVATAFLLGRDWDETLSDVEEVLASDIEPAAEEHQLIFAASIVAARLDGLDEYVKRAEGVISPLPDPHAAAELAWLHGMRDLYAGRPTEASDRIAEAADRASGVSALFLAWAGRAAIWARDPDRVRVIIDSLEQDPDRSNAWRDDIAEMRAALAGLEGRTDDALAGYRTTIANRRAAGTDFIAAWMALDQLIVLGPEIGEAANAAEDVRPLFERLRARAYLERLDEALTRGTEGAARAKKRAVAVPAE